MRSTAAIPTPLTAALKEWAIAVDALTQGKTIVLLRKGGIREPGGSFAIKHSPVWLYPTYEHQKPHLLKPEYISSEYTSSEYTSSEHTSSEYTSLEYTSLERTSPVTAVPCGWHPERIEIPAWASITHVFQISDADAIEALLPFHIWNLQFVADRLKWKPKSPLTVLLLRVYRLPQAHTITYRPSYGGCKSWIDLEVGLSPIDALPVLSEAEFLSQVALVRTALGVDG